MLKGTGPTSGRAPRVATRGGSVLAVGTRRDREKDHESGRGEKQSTLGQNRVSRAGARALARREIYFDLASLT